MLNIWPVQISIVSVYSALLILQVLPTPLSSLHSTFALVSFNTLGNWLSLPLFLLVSLAVPFHIYSILLHGILQPAKQRAGRGPADECVSPSTDYVSPPDRSSVTFFSTHLHCPVLGRPQAAAGRQCTAVSRRSLLCLMLLSCILIWLVDMVQDHLAIFTCTEIYDKIESRSIKHLIHSVLAPALLADALYNALVDQRKQSRQPNRLGHLVAEHLLIVAYMAYSVLLYSLYHYRPDTPLSRQFNTHLVYLSAQLLLCAAGCLFLARLFRGAVPLSRRASV